METCCKSCGKTIFYEEKQSGRRPEYCDDTCRQRNYRANHRQRNRGRNDEKPQSSLLATQKQIQPLTTIAAGTSVPTTPILHYLRHKLVSEHSYTCMTCGWSWADLPERECPGNRMYSLKNKPPYLMTLDQLKQQGLRPGSTPDAYLYREEAPGWYCLYDVRKAVPNGR
jgi:hypothetical protein